MKFKALLFNVQNPSAYRSSGIHRIATIMREEGWDSEVMDWANHWKLDQLKHYCKQRVDSDTKMIGFSCNFGVWTEMLDEFVIWFRVTYPDVKVIIGGQYLPQYKISVVDYYVIGFGENSIIALLKYLEGNGKAPKFKYTNDRKVIDGNSFYPSFPMKSLMIKYEKRDYLEPTEWLGIEFARGCKFECPYCNFPVLGVKGDYTRDSDDYILQMKQTYDDYGIKNYLVADETFNDTTEKLIKFADATEQLNFTPFFTGFIRADLLVLRKQDREHLARMNFSGHFYGVESMNYETCKLIGKGIKTDRLQQGLLDIKRYWKDQKKAYRGTIALVVGLPHETPDSMSNTYSWLENNWLDNNFIVWGLDIPHPDSEGLKPSKISMDLPKYGYEVDTTTYQKRGFWLETFHENYDSSIPWKNEHFDHISAKRSAERFMKSTLDRNKVGNFELVRFHKEPKDTINEQILAHIDETNDLVHDRNSVRLARYIRSKLGVFNNGLTD
jgi:radical SAM superfamily enzyme YgiQ (UPF0313 family)